MSPPPRTPATKAGNGGVKRDAPHPVRDPAQPLDDAATPSKKNNITGSVKTRQVDVLAFTLGAKRFGVELRFVREVFSTGYITPVPLAPPCVAGATNLRGQVVPLISLSSFIPGETVPAPLPGTDALLVEWSDLRGGLLVDRIIEVYRLPLSGYREAHNETTLFPGSFNTAGGEFTLLDVGGVLKKVRRQSNKAARALSSKESR